MIADALIDGRLVLTSRHLVSIRPGRMAIGEFRNRLRTRLLPRRTGERGPVGGMRVQGETKAVSSCSIFEGRKNEGRLVHRPSDGWL